MRQLLAFSLHSTAAAVMTWAWFNLKFDGTGWIESLKGGYTLFLTNQGLVLAWSCMAAALLSDLFPSAAVARYIKRVLLMLSLPLQFIIFATYWSLRLCFPRLIGLEVHSDAGPVLLHPPLLIDLAIHAFPFPALLAEFFFFETKFAKARTHRVASAAIIAFAIWYASYVEYYSTFNSSFPYPFLTRSPFPTRVLIYSAAAAAATGCFKVLDALHP